MTLVMRDNSERQLELFDAAQASAPRPQRESLGRWWFHLRYDQLVLCSVASVIGLTVIFAFGVERGKHLARSERLLLPRRDAAPAAAERAPKAGAPNPLPAESATAKAKPAPAASPKPVAPSKAVAPSKGRYAIQIVTFSRPVLAKQTMDRLQAKGERAFLVMRQGRTAVYIGPFTSKGNASEKLATLKSEYQDCFIRAL